ncbi:Hypothetical predicted protein, partial [Pelobates cultripes]
SRGTTEQKFKRRASHIFWPESGQVWTLLKKSWQPTRLFDLTGRTLNIWVFVGVPESGQRRKHDNINKFLPVK